MPITFVAYIDESGDTGLNLVKKPGDPRGATEWLILSAFVVSIQNDSRMVSWVEEAQAGFTSRRRDLHFNRLLGFKKTLVCGSLARKDATCFVVMSNKANIQNYENKNLGSEKAWLYWWLTRLLLERVTEYCEAQTPEAARGIDKLRIVFSRRGGLRYSDFKEYLELLHYQSINRKLHIATKDIRWSMIDTGEIHILDHKTRAGLQLADVIAGAFYEAVEMNRGGAINCDPSYARLLKPIIAKTAAGKTLGFGIKTMPNLWEMDLVKDQQSIFEHYGYSPDRWKKGG